ncbi:hypothetical protein llap_12417 [Limosa lapponica baueri]|uniref:Uncharacterized protein n=1 Tax=Limosa lapponica baueri TaxID=1758121 RepID=A0A2I0TU01_LIMLA|nr:hypothetical protein llap_12417 [Limosa lapponica baueri]
MGAHLRISFVGNGDRDRRLTKGRRRCPQKQFHVRPIQCNSRPLPKGNVSQITKTSTDGNYIVEKMKQESTVNATGQKEDISCSNLKGGSESISHTKPSTGTMKYKERDAVDLWLGIECIILFLDHHIKSSDVLQLVSRFTVNSSDVQDFKMLLCFREDYLEEVQSLALRSPCGHD